MNDFQQYEVNTSVPTLLQRQLLPGRRRMAGLTIIQLMVTLLIAGIVGTVVVDFIIDKRCEDNPPVKLCMDRKAAGK